MPLSVHPRMENEIAILDLEGALTLGPSLHGLRDAAKQTLAENKPRGLVLQVAKLTAVDSAGLGELTVVYTLCTRQGCRIALAGPGQNLRTMLEVTHLDALLPSAESLVSARVMVASNKA